MRSSKPTRRAATRNYYRDRDPEFIVATANGITEALQRFHRHQGLCRNSIRPSGSPNILRLPALEFSVGAEGLVTFIIGPPNGCFEAGWNYRRRIIQNEAIVVATAAAVE
jgi:hypothetical protein